MAEAFADVIPLCHMNKHWHDSVFLAIGEGIILRVTKVNEVTTEAGAVGELKDLVDEYGIATSMISTRMLSVAKAVEEIEDSKCAMGEPFNLKLVAAKESKEKVEGEVTNLKNESTNLKNEETKLKNDIIRLRGEHDGFKTRCEALEKTLDEVENRFAEWVAARNEDEKKNLAEIASLKNSLAAAQNDVIGKYKDSDDFYDIIEVIYDHGIYHDIRCFRRATNGGGPNVEDMASWPSVAMFDFTLSVYHLEIPYVEADIANFNEKQRKQNLEEWVSLAVNEFNLRSLQNKPAARVEGETVGEQVEDAATQVGEGESTGPAALVELNPAA